MWFKRIWILALMGFITSAVWSGSSSVAQTLDGPTCGEVSKSPEKYVGKSVVFFGSMIRFDMKPIKGKQDTVNTFACKNKDGKAIDGTFAFLSSEAKWTDAAGKANTMKELFRISGVVRREDSSTTFLKGVSIQLASEVK